jgi:hypothetical protein
MSVVHERSDVQARAVLRVVIYLLVATAVVALAIIPLTRGLVAMGKAADPPLAPLAEGPGRLPPAPRLQERPFDDVRAQLAEEEQVLTTPAWVDRDKGIVRIPIAEAMERIARRGLPVAAPAPAPQKAAETR